MTTDLLRPPDGWRIEWAPTPRTGSALFARRLIRISPGLPWRTERCVLAHEIVHAERGSFPRFATALEEAAVRGEAARRLIDIIHLGDALAWSTWPDEVAEELDVDRSTLEARLAVLTQTESCHLSECTEHHRLEA